MRKVRSSTPIRSWRKNTGPGESFLISSPITRNTGASRRRPADEATKSSVRFRSRDDRDSRSGRRPTSGRPSTVWMPTPGPTISNRRGTMSTWTSRSFNERMMLSVSSCVSFEKATITRSTSKSLMIAGRRSDEPRIVMWPRSSRWSFGLASTKPTRLIPYSGCWRSFLATSCPTSPAPRMTVFCRYMIRCRQKARAVARPMEIRPIARPQKMTSLSKCGVRESGNPGTEVEDPGANGDEVEHTQKLVDGRMVRPLLVVVIEAIELRAENPARAA